MNPAMYAAASGMQAEQAQLDVIASDLSNVDTPGFKARQLDFEALAVHGIELGVRQAGEETVLQQGRLVASHGPFDVAIEGAGFFAVRRPDGAMMYTRNGRFERAADGSLQTPEGYVLHGVRIPGDARSVNVDTDGTVWVSDAKHSRKNIGSLTLAIFATPEHLRAIGGGYFEATATSGPARSTKPDSQAAGRLRFGYLEKANVSVMESMIEILTAQRAFEANSKGVQAADEMQRIANNLERA